MEAIVHSSFGVAKLRVDPISEPCGYGTPTIAHPWNGHTGTELAAMDLKEVRSWLTHASVLTSRPAAFSVFLVFGAARGVQPRPPINPLARHEPVAKVPTGSVLGLARIVHRPSTFTLAPSWAGVFSLRARSARRP